MLVNKFSEGQIQKTKARKQSNIFQSIKLGQAKAFEFTQCLFGGLLYYDI